MSNPVLQAQRLSKFFGEHPVLFGVELALEPGQAVVLVGRNGVGKSTLIKIFARLVKPSGGRLVLFGHEAPYLPAAEYRRLGVLLHQSLLYPNLTARENLEFYCELYALPDPRQRACDWLKRVELEAAGDEPVRALSRGMEQRLAVARALLADPELILMDEPFAALDSEGVNLVGGLIREVLARRAAVVLTAHAPLGIDGIEPQTLRLEGGRLVSLKEESRPGRLRSLLHRHP